MHSRSLRTERTKFTIKTEESCEPPVELLRRSSCQAEGTIVTSCNQRRWAANRNRGRAALRRRRTGDRAKPKRGPGDESAVRANVGCILEAGSAECSPPPEVGQGESRY